MATLHLPSVLDKGADRHRPPGAPVPPHLRRQAKALCRRGDRVVAEVLWAALRRLDPADAAAVLEEIERINRHPVEQIRFVDADHFVEARWTVIAGGRR